MENQHKEEYNMKFDVFPWNKHFETDNDIIDNQHRNLVSLLNTLAKTLANNEEIKIETAFKELADYAAIHFSDEQAYWESYIPSDDELVISHIKTHDSFLPAVELLKEKGSHDEIVVVVENVVKFLIRWLAFHIIDNDKRMSLVVDALKKGKSLKNAKILANDKLSESHKILTDTILEMYDDLSKSTIELMRERRARIIAEENLIQANLGLEKLTITDQLTNLYNRRHFNLVFSREYRRAKRDIKPLTCMQIDVDHFKLYNDNYGHLAGDRVLEKVGKFLKDICRRPGDYAFRMGGEEFCLLLSDLSQPKAYEFGEKVRQGIENLKIIHEFNEISPYLTISAGLVNQIPQEDDKDMDLMKMADSQLYEAKAAGRNRVVFS